MPNIDNVLEDWVIMSPICPMELNSNVSVCVAADAIVSPPVTGSEIGGEFVDAEVEFINCFWNV
jgi:hypothetical protein